MHPAPGLFQIQPFARKSEEVFFDRTGLFVSVWLAAAIGLVLLLFVVPSMWSDITGTHPLANLFPARQRLWLCAVLSMGVAALCVVAYARTPNPKDLLVGCVPEARLLAQSAGLVSACLGFHAIQALIKEPTTWSVEWRTNRFGMHAERLLVDNVSGRLAFKLDFNDLPQDLRFTPWEGGDMPHWEDHKIDVICKAHVPVVTAHVRLALASQALANRPTPAPTVGA